jgi:hypothetical protein
MDANYPPDEYRAPVARSLAPCRSLPAFLYAAVMQSTRAGSMYYVYQEPIEMGQPFCHTLVHRNKGRRVPVLKEILQ